MSVGMIQWELRGYSIGMHRISDKPDIRPDIRYRIRLAGLPDIRPAEYPVISISGASLVFEGCVVI
jgi:hypothetical protein